MAVYDFFAVTMHEGRRAIAEQLVTGEPAIQILGFAVGKGGYDPADPFVALEVNPADNALTSQIFPAIGDSAYPSGYKPYDVQEWTTTYSPCFVCVLEWDEGIGPLGEIALFAQYVTGPKAGTKFMYAAAHYPVFTKLPKDRVIYRMVLPF